MPTCRLLTLVLSFTVILIFSLATYSAEPRIVRAFTAPQSTASLPMLTSSQTVTVAAIAVGYYHTCALTSIGNAKCWGTGALGNTSGVLQPTPIGVSGLTFGVTAIASNIYHSCAVISGGVKCWGGNEYGQLGDGTKIYRYTPVDVSGLSNDITAVAAGGYHTCALTTSGGVKCWGNNRLGQLGDGTTIDRLAPVDVNGLTSGIRAITANEIHTCALTTTGGIKCWGDNSFGELGDGTLTQPNRPVDVSGLTSGISKIAAGEQHTCALTEGGGVKCWGDNWFGDLGDGTAIERHTPVGVSGLSGGVSAITAGGFHSCAITEGGGAKCWGRNSNGQLGDGTTTDRLTSVDVSGLNSGVSAIDARYYHTCVLTSSGGAKCWGRNAEGQLGDGTTTERHVPVDVSETIREPDPFLDLPFDYSYYSGGSQASKFSRAALGNVGGQGPGRVNTWFDHSYPDYAANPAGRLTMTTWLNTYTGLAATSIISCTLGLGCYDGHNGIDYQKRIVDSSDELVYAAAPGVVAEVCDPNPCSRGAPYGKYVLVNHQNGYASFYGHLKTISVTNGITITYPLSQPIGIMGGTGGFPVHLHFGLYYTSSVSGPWTEYDIVDPYGWSQPGTDPWKAPSLYIWKYPLYALQSIGTSGASIISPSALASANIPPGALTTTLTLQLWDAPPMAEPSGQLRLGGNSFLLQVLEWLSGTSSQTRSARGVSSANANFSQPVTLTASFDLTSTRHLDLSQLMLYRWSDSNSTWVSLTSTVSISGALVTAQTTNVGEYTLQAPLICPSDTYEPDDGYYTAAPLSTNGTPTTHLFDITGDEDWIRFNSQAGNKYLIQTSNLAAGVDTVLQLYDVDAITLLASNDNHNGGPASRIDWVAPLDGTYFIRVLSTPTGVYGCNASYETSITQMNQIYMPFVLKNP